MQAVSGHKSETSLKAHSKKYPTSKKRQMFDILAMNKSSEVIPAQAPQHKVAKNIPTSTVTKAQADSQNITELDFLDFVPIDNYSNYFDLNKIINAVDKEQIDKNPNQNAVALKTPQDQQNFGYENLPVPNPVPMTSNVNFNTNSTNMQNQPFIPRMIFPHSNVTIYCNFQK